MKTFIVYCKKNKQFADHFIHDLSRTGLQFVRDERSLDSREQDNALLLRESQAPIILLLSDNFLHSKECMYQAFQFVQDARLRARLQTIVIQGSSENGQNIPTQFERVSNVIQYMNYWQDMYLNMRRDRATDSQSIANTEKDIQIVRAISSEIGEFLRLLKEQPYQYFEKTLNQKFKDVFLNMQQPNLVQLYQSLPDYHYSNNGINVVAPTPNITHQTPPTPNLEAQKTPEPQPEPAKPEQIIEKPKTVLERIIEERQKEKEKEQPIPQQDVVPIHTQNMNEVIEEVVKEEQKDNKAQSSVFPERNNVKEKSSFELLQSLFEDDKNPEELGDNTNDIDDHTEKLGDNTNDMDDHTEKLDVEHEQPQEQIIQPLNNIETMQEQEQEQQEEEKMAEKIVNKYNHENALQQAQVHLQNNEIDLAKKQLSSIIDEAEPTPETVRALVILGELAEKENNFLLAKIYYEKAESIDGELEDLHYRLANLLNYEFKGQKKTAAKYYKKALRQNPENIDALYNYGVILYEHLGENKKALELFEKTLQLKPDHPFAQYDKAVIFYEKGLWKKAAIAYLDAVNINPELKTEQNDKAFQIDKYLTKVREETEKLEAEKIAFEKAEEERIAAEKAAIVLPKVMLITGATAGIGLATARLLAKHGQNLILTGRRAERLDALKAELEEAHQIKVHTIVFDVRDAKACQEHYEAIPDELKNIDVLINNAGLAKGSNPIHEGKIQDWETMIDTNVKGLLYMTRLVAPSMVERKKGHIINVSSIAAKQMYPNGNVYSATKAAVDALTKSMRMDLHQHNVKVSSVSPGMVEETEFALVRHNGNAERANIYKDFKPLNSNDIAEVIYFIITRPEYVNINDIDLTCTQQASAMLLDKSGR